MLETALGRSSTLAHGLSQLGGRDARMLSNVVPRRSSVEAIVSAMDVMLSAQRAESVGFRVRGCF